jgi:hypothetical protein
MNSGKKKPARRRVFLFLPLQAWQPVGLNMTCCGKAEFGQTSRSFSLNSGAIRLK